MKQELIITQSFIKDIYKYAEKKQCGLQVEAKYIKGITFPSSDVQLLGQWFEWKATGQKNREGKVPVPPYLKDGKTLPKKYQEIQKHIEPMNKMFEHLGLEIISTGKRIKKQVTVSGEPITIQGDIDVECLHKESGKIVFVDIKTSGLLDNEWDDMGWGDNNIEQKDFLLVQPVQYKILGKLEYGYMPEWYFFVFSNTNGYDRKIFKVEVDETRILEHHNTIETAYKIIKKSMKNGWIPFPSPARCEKCPLKDSCEHFTVIPKVQEVYYG